MNSHLVAAVDMVTRFFASSHYRVCYINAHVYPPVRMVMLASPQNLAKIYCAGCGDGLHVAFACEGPHPVFPGEKAGRMAVLRPGCGGIEFPAPRTPLEKMLALHFAMLYRFTPDSECYGICEGSRRNLEKVMCFECGGKMRLIYTCSTVLCNTCDFLLM